MVRKLEILDEKLLFFLTASRTIVPEAYEPDRLREGLTFLYHTIYYEVEKVQDVWFTNPDFDQFRARPPEDLARYEALSLKDCKYRIYTMLRNFDEVLLFFCGCTWLSLMSLAFRLDVWWKLCGGISPGNFRTRRKLV